MEKRKSQLEHGQPMEQTRRATQVWLTVNDRTSITSDE